MSLCLQALSSYQFLCCDLPFLWITNFFQNQNWQSFLIGNGMYCVKILSSSKIVQQLKSYLKISLGVFILCSEKVIVSRSKRNTYKCTNPCYYLNCQVIVFPNHPKTKTTWIWSDFCQNVLYVPYTKFSHNITNFKHSISIRSIISLSFSLSEQSIVPWV